MFYSNVVVRPDDTGFILSNGVRMTWQEANDLVERWTYYLLSLDIRPGDRIALLVQNEDLHVFFHLALDRLNATVVPLDTAIPGEQLKHLPDIKLLFMDYTGIWHDCVKNNVILLQQGALSPPDVTGAGCSALPAIVRDPLIPSYIVASSGTSASKKWIPVLSAGLYEWAKIEKDCFPLRAPYRVLCTRSPAYDARISEYVRAFAGGGTLVMLSQEQRRDLEAIIRACEQHRSTFLILIASQLTIPTLDRVIERLARAGLKHLLVTGDACSLRLKQVCEKHDVSLWNCYGPTEATLGMSICLMNNLDICDENGQQIVPIGLPNSEFIRFHLIDECLYIESPFLSPGYINDDERSAKNFPTLMINGRETRVFNTENRFSLSADGRFLIFKGRINAEAHCKVAGVKVEAHAIEECFKQYNLEMGRELFQVCVLIKNWRGQLKPVAYLLEQEPIDKWHFIDWLRQRLRAEEIPVCIKIPSLPVLVPSDKIDRQALIRRVDADSELFFNEAAFDHTGADPMMRRLQAIWERVLGVKPLNNRQEFIFSGGDSFSLMTLCNTIQQEISPGFSYRKLLMLPAVNLHNIHQALFSDEDGRTASALYKELTEIEDGLPNCFFLPPLLGEGYITYKNMVLMFKKMHKYNVYGLSDPAIYDEALLPRTLRESAERYVQTILTIQPAGPFHLLGFSYGATIARDVAEVLLDNGHTIRSLQILDGLPPMVYQLLPRQKHAEMLGELSSFVIKTLNGKYYGEQLKQIRYQSIEESAPQEQINRLFDHLLRRVRNQQSRPVLALARQHLLFAQTAAAPRRLPVWAQLYTTNKKMPYLSVVSRIPNLQRWPLLRMMYCWNLYFDNLIYAFGREAGTGHVELLQATQKAQLALYNYWSRAHDPLKHFPAHVRDFTPFYTLEKIPDQRGLLCRILGVTQKTASSLSIPDAWQTQQSEQKPLFEYLIRNAHEEDIRSSRRYAVSFTAPAEHVTSLHGFFQAKGLKSASIPKRHKSVVPSMVERGRQKKQMISITCIIRWNERPLADLSFSCRANPDELLPVLHNLGLESQPVTRLPAGMFLLHKLYFDFHNPSSIYAMSVAGELMNQLVLLLEPLVSPGLKYNNLRAGVSQAKRDILNDMVADIHNGRLSFDRDDQLAVIDSLTLHANHLDQQTVDNTAIEPGKRQLIIDWIEAAYTLARRCLPELDSLISNPCRDILFQQESRLLSSIAMLMHYLGKFRRYQAGSTPEERLPLLTLALDLARHLTLREQGRRFRDPHYYPERIITFMNPVWITISQLGRHDEALQMISAQMEEACRCGFDFHIIQAHNNLAEFTRLKPGEKDPDFCLKHAEAAIARVLENESTPGRESFISHNIYFISRMEAILALQAKAEIEPDQSLSQSFLDEALRRAEALQANPAGAKDSQLPKLDELAEQLQAQMSASSCFAKTT
ncbi:AMP-binding protein [Legionella sp. CNM-4043-24]|uniref:AMP-binding protein n=1 Tax=Legionella sp. CNM-4043-24 TaxID=3421646 RepID=UPI00403AED45